MKAPPRSRKWIWFFVVLVFLVATAVAVESWFKPPQLTLADLQAAQERWRAKGPSDYDLEYTSKTIDNTDVYKIQVRGGKVVNAERNNQPLERYQYHYHSMPELLGFVESYLRQDSQPDAPRTFAVATFDPNDGHLIHYVRSVMSKRERQEITVDFRPLHGP
jgi:hypothetical protein